MRFYWKFVILNTFERNLIIVSQNCSHLNKQTEAARLLDYLRNRTKNWLLQNYKIKSNECPLNYPHLSIRFHLPQLFIQSFQFPNFLWDYGRGRRRLSCYFLFKKVNHIWKFKMCFFLVEKLLYNF